MIRHGIQLMIFQPRIQRSADGNRINRRKIIGSFASPTGGPNKGGVKRRIVGHQYPAFPAEIVKS